MKDRLIYHKTRKFLLASAIVFCVALTTFGQQDTVINNDRLLNLTIIVLKPDTFSYYSKRPGLHNIITRKALVEHLTREEQTWGDSLHTIIKPTSNSGVKAVVDLLDDFQKFRMGRYSIEKLTEEEKRLFRVEDMDFNPSQVTITAPGPDTSEVPVTHYLNIEIRKDNSVWYQPVSPTIRSILQKVSDPVTKNLEAIIAEYEMNNAGIKRFYFIRGHKESDFKVFESVVTALRNNKIHQYQLSTLEE